MKEIDILFVGHMCYDEISTFEGEKTVAPGSAVLCGAMAAVRTGKKIGVYTRMSKKYEHILVPMKELGIEVFIEESEHTTFAVVIHPSANMDERELHIRKSAGFVSFDNFPAVKPKHVHLAGISDSELTIACHLPGSFFFFKPRDIVSGDFYWFHAREDCKIILAADCTGHGVPGAFMSMVGITLLNQIIKEKKLTDPGIIIKNLDEEINKALGQSSKSRAKSKDGMDISICTIWNDNKVSFAGAGRPIYVVRDGEIERFKSGVRGVGGILPKNRVKSFPVHTFEVKSTTHIYLFSDGFTDQVSEKREEKFKTDRFKNLLFDIHSKKHMNQKDLLEKAFQDWKGSARQIDDILVIGFQLNKS